MADGRSRLQADEVIAGRPHRLAGRPGSALFPGSAESVAVNDMVEAAWSVTGTSLPARHVPSEPAEMPAVIIDILASRSLGYAPRCDLTAARATVWPEFSETAK